MPIDLTGVGPVEHEPTRLETMDEIHKAVQALLAASPGAPAPAAEALPPGETAPFRPRVRAARALVCILDDGLEDGEWVRLRGERYVIGRCDGEIRIPDDGLMSARHAELSRKRLPGGIRWVLADLNSTNGTFVRVGSTPLAPGQQVLVGHTHLRFEAGPPAEAGAELGPSVLVDVSRPDRRYLLTGKSVWVGRDPDCGVCLDDPCVSPKHARLIRDRRGRWRVENNKSRNGLWLRVQQITLDTACQFQLGEQRFVFRHPAV